jgi:hypothetical protein
MNSTPLPENMSMLIRDSATAETKLKDARCMQSQKQDLPNSVVITELESISSECGEQISHVGRSHLGKGNGDHRLRLTPTFSITMIGVKIMRKWFEIPERIIVLGLNNDQKSYPANQS